MSEFELKPSCCNVKRDQLAPAEGIQVTGLKATRGNGKEGMVYLPGGSFWMGTDDAEGFPSDGEGPVSEVELSPFYIDETTVTNAQFADFVQDTGFVTEALLLGS
ncbi:formylglycine-generating enzyme family protein [Paenibacillus aestuarii]|uniref:Formylglycine-generating enzyme family protein n=1 Tax=Paenibacillus aestuarii TaxID=516965 RepID=A0ABW0KGA7_9BACL|nr:SUMF1/EgtB/PvdO family nonheme iron enzyme [Paenibacillus aestuarii]